MLLLLGLGAWLLTGRHEEERLYAGVDDVWRDYAALRKRYPDPDEWRAHTGPLLDRLDEQVVAARTLDREDHPAMPVLLEVAQRRMRPILTKPLSPDARAAGVQAGLDYARAELDAADDRTALGALEEYRRTAPGGGDVPVIPREWADAGPPPPRPRRRRPGRPRRRRGRPPPGGQNCSATWASASTRTTNPAPAPTRPTAPTPTPPSTRTPASTPATPRPWPGPPRPATATTMMARAKPATTRAKPRFRGAADRGLDIKPDFDAGRGAGADPGRTDRGADPGAGFRRRRPAAGPGDRGDLRLSPFPAPPRQAPR